MNEIQQAVQHLLDELVGSGRERGAQAAIYLDGELVADAGAGIADPFENTAVTTDTLFPVFSVSKGVSATVIHRLVERGLFDYDTRIAEVWPAFGMNGKGSITVRHALMHTAGIPALPRGLTFAEMIDWSSACAALAAVKPEITPGTLFAYHAKTFGWMIGEVARLADGRTFSDQLREEITGPLGIAEFLHIGISPDQLRHPVAFLEEQGQEPREPFAPEVILPMEAAQVPMVQQMNNRGMWATCMPSSNGIMNARAIARHYAALAPGGVDDIELLTPERMAIAVATETLRDTLGNPVERGLGYPPHDLTFEGKRFRAFGHGGYGGAMGLVFPELRMSIGFTRNRMNAPSAWEEIVQTVLKIIRK